MAKQYWMQHVGSSISSNMILGYYLEKYIGTFRYFYLFTITPKLILLYSHLLSLPSTLIGSVYKIPSAWGPGSHGRYLLITNFVITCRYVDLGLIYLWIWYLKANKNTWGWNRPFNEMLQIWWRITGAHVHNVTIKNTKKRVYCWCKNL